MTSADLFTTAIYKKVVKQWDRASVTAAQAVFDPEIIAVAARLGPAASAVLPVGAEFRRRSSAAAAATADVLTGVTRRCCGGCGFTISARAASARSTFQHGRLSGYTANWPADVAAASMRLQPLLPPLLQLLQDMLQLLRRFSAGGNEAVLPYRDGCSHCNPTTTTTTSTGGSLSKHAAAQ